MTPRTWAVNKVNKLPMARGSESVNAKDAARLIEQEHQRAVRIVKRELKDAEKDYSEYDGNDEQTKMIGRLIIDVHKDILAALERGRSTRRTK